MAFKYKHDYVAKVDASCEDLALLFESHLEDSYDFTTELQGDDHYLSINDDYSLSKNIFRGTPSLIKWSVSESEDQKSLIRIRFELHPETKKRLYKYAAILGFATFLFFPNAIRSLSDTDFVGRAWWTIISYMPTTIALVFAYYIGVLISSYRRFGEGVLNELSHQCLGNGKAEQFEFDDYPHRVLPEAALFSIYLLMALIPSIVGRSRAHLPLSFTISAGILVAAFVLIIFLGIKSLRGSLLHAKIIAIGQNMTLAAGFVIVFLFIPISTKARLQEIIELDEFAQTKYGVTIPTMFLKADQYSTASFEDLWTLSRGVIAMILGVQFIFICCSYFFRYICSQPISTELSGRKSKHVTHIERLFHKTFPSNIVSQASLELSKTLIYTVWVLYASLAIVLWYSVYATMSVFTALLWPDLPNMHFSYGKTIAAGATTLMGIFFQGHSYSYGRYLAIAILSPLLFFLIYFIWNNIYFAVKSMVKYWRMPKIKDSMVETVTSVARQMNVDNVICLKDDHSNSLTPSARISGVKPKNILVFTNNSLTIMHKHPEYTEAIIAHEVAHLKTDCKKFRRYSILSRLGLVGVGFLSVLHDSIAMEDKADELARKYLKDNNKDDSLVKAAASMIENYQHLLKHGDQSQNISSLAFSEGIKGDTANRDIRGRFFLIRFLKAVSEADRFYFNTEIYDYLHREAKYR